MTLITMLDMRKMKDYKLHLLTNCVAFRKLSLALIFLICRVRSSNLCGSHWGKKYEGVG